VYKAAEMIGASQEGLEKYYSVTTVIRDMSK